jgi:ElaB/YqjD/DUF883 family membrane-anchored ribosome-binding protein
MAEYSTRTSSDSVGSAMRNLIADMKVLASDTRELLRQTTGPSGEQFARLRERTRDTLAAVEERLGPLQHKLAEQGRYAAQVSAEHLRVHRWSTLAAVAAIGFAIAAVLAWQNETPADDTPEE